MSWLSQIFHSQGSFVPVLPFTDPLTANLIRRTNQINMGLHDRITNRKALEKTGKAIADEDAKKAALDAAITKQNITNKKLLEKNFTVSEYVALGVIIYAVAI